MAEDLVGILLRDPVGILPEYKDLEDVFSEKAAIKLLEHGP